MEDRHAHFEVFQVGILVLVEVVQYLLLLNFVLLKFLFIKILADFLVDLVIVYLVQPLRGHFIPAVELGR
ncbi:MAG: hypothetical protein COT39_03285 [Parcubacteria group bacterium CG08_land_8_20_14_0_20_48_21]|nr:MAG: hypothetical protein AUK21_04500 [Parcubacteria group bacterium CG2_30_48_51]PIS32694.1 MAG: hypothetical protein COT39_03285 [Parcubacteria group bacterium CG08_land_8_20_14_0_20_48_21]PIW79035.1 MAG: hypothetical protein COZ99_03385 [Parcubacteria group bacterium CG_4_8_14_3_um_filter_48_16]